MEETRIPALIIGGGGCGLSASNMLSNLGVEHVLIERHTSTSILPKAHALNQRTAEILYQHDLWHVVREKAADPEHMCHFLYSTSLRDGRVDFATKSVFGNDVESADHATYKRDSAYLTTNLPQLRLERILRSEAEKRNPGRVLFNHEAVSFTEREHSVSVEVLNRATGVSVLYVVDYLIAADGGKMVGPALGVKLEGPGHVGDATSVHFKADLSPYWRDGDLMAWLVSVDDPDNKLATPSALFGGDWSAVVQMGPTWGKHSEEWVIHLSLGQTHVAVEALTDDEYKAYVRRVLGIPDLEIELLKASRWRIQGVYATQYQTKRIFLAGDAVHRHPPNTGLGLNTAIQDAHNLTWKLAAVLRGHASPSLLGSYQTERQPIGKRNMEWALYTFMNFRHLDTAVGLIPGLPRELQVKNKMLYQQLCEDSLNGEARRASVAYAAQGQRVEYAAHDLELGAAYSIGALVADGTTAPARDPRGHRYTPVARPGHRLPHAWLQGRSKRVSTHSLLDGQGSWLLLTDNSADGKEWVAAAANMTSRFGLKINAVQIGGDGEFKDDTGQWRTDSGLESSTGGAVLVRPDGYVALRALSFVPNVVDQLGTILGI